ncbi:hypothetical protein TELCIR_12623 [Teladorsagia circumcincta]|uniref:Uncharacterized protein n=1 Tax=Teladorsagia circumcincta TaxID=45464 RepID=A0A2G9U5Z7_TELCI|nr:hypothetical protein TELCIR_12623 [Teladorsagia circumcincta]
MRGNELEAAVGAKISTWCNYGDDHEEEYARQMEEEMKRKAEAARAEAEAERKAAEQRQAQLKAQQEAALKAAEEQAKKAQEEALRKAQQAKAEAEAKAKAEQAKKDAEAKARKEAEEKAKAAAQAKAREAPLHGSIEQWIVNQFARGGQLLLLQEEMLAQDVPRFVKGVQAQKPALKLDDVREKFIEKEEPAPEKQSVKVGLLAGASRWEEEAAAREQAANQMGTDGSAPTAVRLQRVSEKRPEIREPGLFEGILFKTAAYRSALPSSPSLC